MLEFYEAYATYRDFMDLTEELMRSLASEVLGTSTLTYQGESYDFSKPFARMTLKEAILRFNAGIETSELEALEPATEIARHLEIPVPSHYGLGKVLYEIFEKTAEASLKNPTFVTDFPVEVSPLSRHSDRDPFVTERFELFVAGREIANGFSELNDPDEQAERFRRQVAARAAGDQEAMYFDEDYIAALEHGLPPTAGEGVGIDRLVMLFTDSPSIRDVLLFPHLRPRD